MNASTAIASLLKEKVSSVWLLASSNIIVRYDEFENTATQDEMFASCRFSVDGSGNEVLYVAANTGKLIFSHCKNIEFLLSSFFVTAN